MYNYAFKIFFCKLVVWLVSFKRHTKVFPSFLVQNFAEVFFAVCTSMPVGYNERSGRTDLCHAVVVSLTLHTLVTMAVFKSFTVRAARRTDRKVPKSVHK